MRKVILFLMFFLIVPVTFADITIRTDQNIYNLGNKIKASASVLQDKNFDGLFKLTISCGNYKLQYFLTPISLEANFRTAVNVPELAATESMLGNCTLTGDLVTNNNLVIEEHDSNNFGITNQLAMLPVKTKITAFPSGTILISGVINEAFGNNILKAAAKIALDNNSYAIDAIDGKFNLTLELARNIKSGKHTIKISASDSKNNAGSYPIELDVTAIPTYIKTELNNDKLLPGAKIEIASSIYDQADDLINDSLNLDLTSPKGDNVFTKVVQSHDQLDYEFSQYAVPGLYELSSTYKNLFNKASINITAVRSVNIKYENETVVVENTGNVPFIDELTFFLESESKKYPIIKKISIEPGRIVNVDLSKEVPLGIYNVTLPFKEGIGSINEKINDTLQNWIASAEGGLSSILPQKENVLAADVTIHDNRPVYKKIAGGINSISGALVGSDGLLSKNPVVAPMILIAVVLLVAFRYGRKPIMRLIRRRKEDDKKDNEI